MFLLAFIVFQKYVTQKGTNPKGNSDLTFPPVLVLMACDLEGLCMCVALIHHLVHSIVTRQVPALSGSASGQPVVYGFLT